MIDKEQVTDMILQSDLITYGVAFIRLTVDEEGNVVRERIHPLEIEKDIVFKE